MVESEILGKGCIGWKKATRRGFVLRSTSIGIREP